MDLMDLSHGFNVFIHEFNENMFFGPIWSRSELPTSRYATFARNFDTNPMEYLPEPKKKKKQKRQGS